MRCDLCQNLITDALYGELSGEDLTRFQEHVASCRECSELYEQMRATLNVMSKRELPDPGQAYWDGYWNRLNARMENEEAEKSGGWLGRLLPGLSGTSVKWAYRGALAVLLIVLGAVGGRMILPGTGTEPVSVAERPDVGLENTTADSPGQELLVQPASTEACARQYLEDSQVLLLALVNFDSENEAEYLADVSPEKRRSRELIAQAASLKTELSAPNQRRLRRLVTELELILIQIANMETGGDLDAVELIRSSVNDRDVMLKIDIEKMRGANDAELSPGACDT